MKLLLEKYLCFPCRKMYHHYHYHYKKRKGILLEMQTEFDPYYNII